MNARTAVMRHERHLDALMDAANVEAQREDELLSRRIADQISDNWSRMLSYPDFAASLIFDWTADPGTELAEIYRELAKVKAGLVCVDDAARIVFRNIERCVDQISQLQVEQEQ